MTLGESIKKRIKESGYTMTWVIGKINRQYPKLNFTVQKLSASLNNNRTLTADELLVICKVLKVNPDVFMPMDDTESHVSSA